MNILDDLEFRGLINQVSDLEGLKEQTEQGPITLYCGFDPTADSLHVGSLVPILTLRRFQEAGHRVIPLVGGGTGLIGDPSFKAQERQLNSQEVVEEWSDKLKNQLSGIVKFEGDNPAKVVNNYDWLGGLQLIPFLRDVGKHLTVNYMMAKESMRSRVETGLSFTEFSYMLMQAYDFLNLYDKEDCRLQVGGSDQWGNITAGLELIRREGKEESAFALTVPLVTKSDGTKFGKTESGAIWLDAEKTTPYEFYQFFLNSSDEDVVKFLKYFTFLSREEIEALEEKVKVAPEKREAQRTLAEEVTKLVHGEEALKQAIRISEALFGGDVAELTAAEIKQGFKDVPSFAMASKEDVGLIDLLVDAGVSSSKRQAREDIKNGAIYINGERDTDLQRVVGADDRIEDQFVIIRRGKKKYFLIHYV
ncbi:MAG TPA: tyrosine--tRNA ligase [Bacillales bacterium]|nr:tyrosine--tRNA ligase [Bacillales bacterium]